MSVIPAAVPIKLRKSDQSVSVGSLYSADFVQIYTHPELSFAEFKAHDKIVDFLSSLGFKVNPGAYGFSTAFEAEFGSGGRVVTFNAEYDALPSLGHACGHNLIASASIAAFIGAAAALRSSKRPGRIRLLGTPAEEKGGGKLKLLEKGAYKDVDACLMSHACPDLPDVMRGIRGCAYARSTVSGKLSVTFTGKPAHAALSPWKGTNAQDAAALSYSAISMLRQQIHPNHRISGIPTHGFESTNTIPSSAKLLYNIRGGSQADTEALRRRVEACFRGAAIATGCEVIIESDISYSDMRPNKALCSAYTQEMDCLNAKVNCDFEAQFPYAWSSDQGNVSYVCPSIHTFFPISPAEVFNHTAGFQTASGTDDAFDRAIEVGKGLAATAYRFLLDDDLAAKVRADFEEDKALRAAEKAAVL